MKHLPVVVALFVIFLTGCDRVGETTESSPNVRSAPKKDPVAELKLLLDRAAKAPIHDDPSGWLKSTRWEITNMDVSKTDSLTAPYRGTLNVRATQTDNEPTLWVYRVSLDYGDKGWRWDGSMRLWENGKETEQDYVMRANGTPRNIFIEHFRFPTE